MSPNLRAAAFLSLTMTLFAVSDAAVKVVLQNLPVGQVLGLRGLMICAILTAWLTVRRRWGRLSAVADRVNLARALVEVCVAVTFFKSLSLLPLADATVLLFTAPIVMTAIAAAWLKETVGWRRWTAVLVGFAGAVVVAAPTGEGFSAAVAFPLAAAVFVAARDLLTRHIRPDLDAAAVALTTAVAVTLGGLATAPFGWVVPGAKEVALLAFSAGCIALAYTTVVIAYRLGEASFLAPFRYVPIPTAVVLGLLVFGEVPGWNVFAGAAVIAASGLFILYRERAVKGEAREPAPLASPAAAGRTPAPRVVPEAAGEPKTREWP